MNLSIDVCVCVCVCVCERERETQDLCFDVAVLINTHISPLLVFQKVSSSKEEVIRCPFLEQTKKIAINEQTNNKVYPVKVSSSLQNNDWSG
jgi:hypothetical protein